MTAFSAVLLPSTEWEPTEFVEPVLDRIFKLHKEYLAVYGNKSPIYIPESTVLDERTKFPWANVTQVQKLYGSVNVSANYKGLRLETTITIISGRKLKKPAVVALKDKLQVAPKNVMQQFQSILIDNLKDTRTRIQKIYLDLYDLSRDEDELKLALMDLSLLDIKTLNPINGEMPLTILKKMAAKKKRKKATKTKKPVLNKKATKPQLSSILRKAKKNGTK